MKEHNYFVRTRDNIYQGRDDFIVLKDQELYIKHFQDHIVKIADTIEELCDEFVVADGDQIATFRNLKIAKSTKGDLYGNIIVNGLSHSVAKMNKEGVFELL